MNANEARALAQRVANIAFAPETLTVGRHDIAKFASAIGATDPAYYDARAAAELGHRDIVAPRGFYISLGTARGRLVPRATFADDGLPAEEKLDGARLVVGGTSATFFDEIHAGDTITVEQSVRSATERDGRSGPLVIVTLERRYRRDDGTPVVTESITRILR
jgi:hypothetical protein